MFWTGMAIGVVIALVFHMILLIVVGRVKSGSEAINADLRQFWLESLEGQQEQIEAIKSLGKKGISLDRLHEIFSTNFGPPFLLDGTVRTRMVSDKIMEIKIGARDIWLSRDGEVVAARTVIGKMEETCETP